MNTYGKVQLIGTTSLYKSHILYWIGATLISPLDIWNHLEDRIWSLPQIWFIMSQLMLLHQFPILKIDFRAHSSNKSNIGPWSQGNAVPPGPFFNMNVAFLYIGSLLCGKRRSLDGLIFVVVIPIAIRHLCIEIDPLRQLCGLVVCSVG